MAGKKSRKFSSFVIYFVLMLKLRPVYLQQLKEMQCSRLGM